MIREPGYQPRMTILTFARKGNGVYRCRNQRDRLIIPRLRPGVIYFIVFCAVEFYKQGDQMGRLIFVTGGTRSGKSAFAEEVTAALGSDVTYIATARAGDGEMEKRIALHRQRRPAGWRTVEEPAEVRAAIELWGERSEVILLDCLTIFISNLMLAGEPVNEDDNPSNTGPGRREAEAAHDREIVQAVEQIAAAAKAAKAVVVVVSNEVGLSLVSPYPLGRRYQELVGWANQIMAGAADETYLVVAGIPLDLKAMGRQVRDRFREEKVRHGN